MQTQFGQAIGPHVEIYGVRGQAAKDVDATFGTELDVGSCLESAELRAVGEVLYLVFELFVAERVRL